METRTELNRTTLDAVISRLLEDADPPASIMGRTRIVAFALRRLAYNLERYSLEVSRPSSSRRVSPERSIVPRDHPPRPRTPSYRPRIYCIVDGLIVRKTWLTASKAPERPRLIKAVSTRHPFSFARNRGGT